MSSDIRMNAEIKELAMWRAVNLQLVCFPVDPQIGLAANWWSNLTGIEECESTRKRMERVDDGAYQGRGLKMQIDLLRTVWITGPLATDDTIPNFMDDVPTLGDFSVASDDFREVMHKWLTTDCPPIYRLSFAGHVLWKQETREAAYAKLGEFLPMQIDPEATEFLYRINRKRPSTIIVGDINCLRTWSALKFEMQIGLLGAAASHSHVKFGTSLQFDVNTPAERTEELPRESLCDLLDELIDMARRIADEGDAA